MKCVQCNAEFVRSKNPRHIYRGKLCGKRAHREATEILKGNEGPDLESVPQRVSIDGIEIPPIPLEYKFLYGAPMRPMRLAEKFLPEQKEMRAAAVRTMVASGTAKSPLRDDFQEFEGMHNGSGVW